MHGASRKLMEQFIASGLENPGEEPNYAGFLQVFSAWIFEDNLAFTTGESPALKRVFKYLKIKFQLPTDTTVRKTLNSIVDDLHATVVKEISVCLIVKISMFEGLLTYK
jgi:hypothetical protein